MTLPAPRYGPGPFWEHLTWVGTLGAVALTVHALVNRRLLRVPAADPPEVAERVSVLVPARDEELTLGNCLADLRQQAGVPDLEILVLDDGSTDGTADVARRAARLDRRVRLLTGEPLPAGWLGKPHACHGLAGAATGSVLVFVDADVRLAPHALASTVDLLRSAGTDLVSPYPRQVALCPAERLLQPLQQWSWLTCLPLRVAENSPRPSLSAACGQLLAVDAAAYRRAGGHRAVRDRVLEDVELLRAVKRSGGRGGVADGTALASCRMYRDWPSVRDGWSKSLWAAFGGPARAAAVLGALAVLYVVPALAALGGSGVGLVGYLAGTAGRCVCAGRTGGRRLPDGLAHPVSVALLGWLTARSCSRHRSGRLTWKGRTIPVPSGQSVPRTRRAPARRDAPRARTRRRGGPAELARGGKIVNETFPADPQGRRARSRRARPRRSAGSPAGLPVTALVAAGLVGVGALAFAGSRLSGPPARTAPSLTPTTPVGLEVEVRTLAEGFPTDLVPRPPDSTITSSAAEPRDGGGTTVSLTGQSPDRVSALLSFYRVHLGKKGFTEVSGGVQAGVPGAVFTRSDGTEVLTLAIMDREDSRSFSIGGTVDLQDGSDSGGQGPGDTGKAAGQEGTGPESSRTAQEPSERS